MSGSIIDCTGPAQDARREMLRRLLEKMYSGVESVSDRGRSVNYAGIDDLAKLINNLRGEIALCDGTAGNGRTASSRRIIYVPYDKWL